MNNNLIQYAPRLSAFGEYLTAITENTIPESEQQEWELILKKVEIENPWFTKNFILKAIEEWGKSLQINHLEEWLHGKTKVKTSLQVGVICAGNIPAVGFHDALCVLLSGHTLVCKPSSSDKVLMQAFLNHLIHFVPEWEEKIVWKEEKLGKVNAVIATGSNNTSRYFEYYFKDIPKIIRKNRTSVAVLHGDETPEDLKNLGYDLFDYFGLGCRNVSKLFVPKEWDIQPFFQAIQPFGDTLQQHHKFANNYDYNRAIYLLDAIDFYDNAFVMLKRDEGLHPPLSVIFWQEYSIPDEVKNYLETEKENIQVVVGKGFTPFGQSQSPTLWDYADGVDTLDFLKTCSVD